MKERAANLPNVRFLPFQPAERVAEVYSLGDCCAVMCKKGTGGIGVPSKTWTIMACARPLLVSFDAGELCDLVHSKQVGICSPAGDAQELADSIKQLQVNNQYGDNARRLVVEKYNKHIATDRYVELIRSVTAQ